MNTQSKYETIPFGYFQNMINSIESMETKVDTVLANGQDKVLSKLMKSKSRLELCEIVSYEFDPEIGLCEIHYRLIDMPKSFQTDEGNDAYTIEAVMQNGNPVEYSGRDEQNILDWLNEKFPVSEFKRA